MLVKGAIGRICKRSFSRLFLPQFGDVHAAVTLHADLHLATKETHFDDKYVSNVTK